MILKTESELIEFKSVWKDDFLMQICSFANNKGGTLYIGISDSGEIIGLKNTKKVLEDLWNKIINHLGIIPHIQLHTENDLQYGEIKIDKNVEAVSYKGRYYIRSGATTQELKGNLLQNFVLKKQNISWDEIGIEYADIDDIDLPTVKKFIEKAILVNRLTKEARSYDLKTFFENLNLFDNTGAIKRAAILAFSNNPTKFFPSLSLKIGRFVSDTDIVVQDVLEDNLMTMAENVIPILRSKYLKSIISYQGVQRIEKLEYPQNALREALFNAIVHRDYSGDLYTVKSKKRKSFNLE